MPEIKFDEAMLQQIVSKAILEGLGDDQRDAIMAAAVEYLITAPPRSNRSMYEPQPKSPIQEAFDTAVSLAMRTIARDMVADNAELQARIRTLFGEMIADALNQDNYSTFAENARKAFGEVLANFRVDR